MIPVVALVRGAELRASVARSVGTDAEVQFCDRTSQLRELVASHGALAVITEVVDGAGADTRATIALLAERLAGIQIIVIHDRPPPEADELLELGRIGVSAWIHQAARNFTPALRAALARAEARTPAAAILARALPLVPPDLHPFFVHCAQAGVAHLEAEEAARAAGFAPRSLRRRLTAAGLPPAWQIIRWNRGLHMIWRLDLSGRPVKTLAAPFGFESAPALRKYVVRLTGLTIGTVLARGGFRYLLGRYERALGGGTGGARA